MSDSDYQNRSTRKWTRLRPCGGVFLQGATRAVAIADFIIVAFVMVFNVVGTANAYKDMGPSNWLIILTVVYFVLYGLYMLLAGVLFAGSAARDRKKCIVYLIVSLFLFVIDMGLVVVHLTKLGGATSFVIVVFIAFHCYKLYSFWVVISFIKEINDMGHYNDMMRDLSNDEIQQFLNGDPNFVFGGAEGGIANVAARPFQTQYEIDPERLLVRNDAILGMGAYGLVVKGMLRNPNGAITDVAVKTTKPESTDVTYFKSLLYEVKMMAYLGPHVNIVNLIGAVTTEIRQRKLLIVVEFCPKGNLEGFIRNNRKRYRNCLVDDEIKMDYEMPEPSLPPETTVEDPGYENMESFCTEDLVVWASQIARGMSYLASKHVIHGDLATRNVLLMLDHSVKITDFGLSRKMYNYKSYVKKETAPLPWRFMAIESLNELSFSTKSDVWGYGVTLWELFTLGKTPYPGMSWTADFADKLRNGLRLEKPEFATSEIYNIMLQCWANEPESRPGFPVLQAAFETILARINPGWQSDNEMDYGYYAG